MALLNPYNYNKPKNALKAKDSKKNNLHEIRKEPKTKKDIYLEQKILVAKPEQLTLMLYDGLVRFLKQGKLFLSNGEDSYDKVNNSLQRGQAIIHELRATLDMDIVISQNLDLLYEYMSRRTMDANMDKDEEVLDEVIELSVELRDTWKQAMESL
jgi:flagellar protein FliS